MVGAGTRTWVRRVVPALALLFVAAACTVPPPYPYRSALTPGLKPPVTLIGDSTMAAMVWRAQAGDPAAQNVVREKYTMSLQAESCRRLVAVSCRGRFGYVPPNTLDVMRSNAGALGEAIVIMAGYDDYSIGSAIDVLMAEANRQGVPHVVVLTYRADVSYVLPGGVPARGLYDRHNAVLAEKARWYANLHIADWNLHSAAHSDWFGRDGIHLSPTGTVELARFITAFLDSLPLGRCLPGETVGSAPSALPAPPPAPTAGYTSASIRAADTRPGDPDALVRKLGADRVLSVPLPGGVPSDVTALTVRVWALEPCRGGQVAVSACAFDARAGRRAAFNGAGWAILDAPIARPKRSAICVWASAPVDIAVDVLGWIRPAPPPTTTTTTTPTTTTAPPTAVAPSTTIEVVPGAGDASSTTTTS